MNKKLILPAGVVLVVVGLVFAVGRTPSPDRSVPTETRIKAKPTIAEIDKLIETQWRDEAMKPPQATDDLQVLRRLSLALHGTLPALDEIRAFEADTGPDRLGRWTEQMLDDERFGDYFAERFARTVVGTEDGAFLVFRRDRLVDWLGEQIQNDRPWSEITAELIAGCGLWTGSPQTNFVTGAFANDEIDENKLAGRTVRAFLGQRIDCAQCHDHPFVEEWKQQDFEGLAAYYSQATFNLAGITDQDSLLFELDRMPPKAGEVPPALRRQFRQNDQRLKKRTMITTVQPERVWVVGDRSGSGESQEGNDEDMAEEPAYDYEPRFVVRAKRGGTYAVYDAAYEHLPGDVLTTEPRVVEPLPPFNPDWMGQDGTRREQLAKWVTHRENDRFGRAIANRVWGLVFGKPYYDPVDDLPNPGDAGTVVLDVLADDFREHNDSVKRLVRVITATRAFRAASTTGELSSPSDYENVKAAWAVFPMTRLRPEQVIGSMLQASYVRTVDQNSHLFVRAARFFNEQAFVREYGDLGDAELDERAGTIPQALLRMNGNLTSERTKVDPFGAAGRILALSQSNEAIIENCFLVCLSRRPTSEEKNHFLAQFAEARGNEREHITEDLFWSLFNSDEFSWNH